MLERILLAIIVFTAGILVVIYHRWFVKTVGISPWAERYLGGGGTYLMWQLNGGCLKFACFELTKRVK